MQSKVRVVHFISNATRSFYLNAIAEHANRQAFDLTIGTLSPAGALQEDIVQRGLPVLAGNCTGRAQFLAAIFRLAAFLKQRQIDVLQTHLYDASLIGLLAGRLARTPLLILTGHHSHEFSRELASRSKKLPYWVDCLMSRYLSNAIIAPSTNMQEIFVRDEQVPTQKIKVLPYGFDLQSWNVPATTRAEVRQELGLEGKTVFGAIGRLYWVKDYPTMFRAFARVARANSQLILLVVGEGSEEAGLRQLANELGIGQQVRFTGYRLDAQRIMSALDVLVHSSLAESFCQVIVEAFAQRIPVVSTAVGVSLDIVRDGKTGFLVPPGDENALGAAMEKMLNCQSQWPQMGAAGYQIVQQFSVEKIIPRYEAQYLEWLKERGSYVGA